MTGRSDRKLPAGDFSAWLRRTRASLQSRGDADVPCGECNACCRSSYFIHVDPDEAESLAQIPEELLFPAPGRTDGKMLLGFDEQGHCPMLVDDRCSIYEIRPRACRAYDCRVFAAVGIAAGGRDKSAVTEQALRWQFSYPTEQDRVEHAAVQAAAKRLGADKSAPEGSDNATGLALRAITQGEMS